MPDASPFPFAGIWKSWKSLDDTLIESCSILTTMANSHMAPIHDRMPAILHPEEFDFWQHRTANDPFKFQRLYQPYPTDLMATWPVSRLVNSRQMNPAIV